MRKGRLASTILIMTAALCVPFALVAGQGGRPLSAVLSGTEEVPGPGDPDGRGIAGVGLNQGQELVCFEISVSDIAPATAAHIHAGQAGVAGPVVIALTPPTTGFSSGCVEAVNPELIKSIGENPSGFYVNVANMEFPAGAVRGQLSN